MNTPDREFDGEDERFKTHRGAEFGLPGEVYRRIANTSMSAKRYAGIEPCSIEPLDNLPGCKVTLYGEEFAFYLTVEAGRQPRQVRLDSVQLDQPEILFRHIAGDDIHETWRRVIDVMLAIDGITAEWRRLTYEEASELMRRQGLL